MTHFHGIFQSRIFQKYSVSKLFPRSIFHLPNFHFSFPQILEPVLFISDYSSEVFCLFFFFKYIYASVHIQVFVSYMCSHIFPYRRYICYLASYSYIMKVCILSL